MQNVYGIWVIRTVKNVKALGLGYCGYWGYFSKGEPWRNSILLWGGDVIEIKISFDVSYFRFIFKYPIKNIQYDIGLWERSEENINLGNVTLQVVFEASRLG